ncbi:MAG: DNA-processing protein DprA [Ferruginibacter sp.]
MDNDLLYQVALSMVPGIGDVNAKSLVNIYGDATSIFKAPKKQLEKIEGIGSIRAGSLKHFNDFKTCEEEIEFIIKYKIQPVFINSDAYPKRLINCYDSPVLLYYRGSANLNAQRIVSIVGTRNNSAYGRSVCEQLIEELKDHRIIIISGLAFGIDTIAHRSAIKNNLETIGVLAHGLDRIYPSQNKALAKLMTAQGGLLTDFKSRTNPDKQNFPKRNRIVASVCDALVVIESAQKGGSLITAELANSYNKDVFAIPGRTTDNKSEGCNYLIKNNKAQLITTAADLLYLMNWNEGEKPIRKKQRELFIDLTDAERTIINILNEKENSSIDELYFKSGLSSSMVAQALLMLEMNGLVSSLPGKIYKMQ